MNWQDYIERDPEVMLGKPVFKGTRIAVEFILERLGQGATAVELLESYVGLRPEHVRAAQAYVALNSVSPFVAQTGSQSAM